MWTIWAISPLHAAAQHRHHDRFIAAPPGSVSGLRAAAGLVGERSHGPRAQAQWADAGPLGDGGYANSN